MMCTIGRTLPLISPFDNIQNGRKHHFHIMEVDVLVQCCCWFSELPMKLLQMKGTTTNNNNPSRCMLWNQHKLYLMLTQLSKKLNFERNFENFENSISILLNVG